MDINERKLKILKIIIDDFINSAQPVGSRTIAKKYPIGISPATIRNEMADLEDLGYLMQPHTSAGRIPSDLGYRLYVDTLMNDVNLKKEQETVVKSLLMSNMIEVKDVIEKASALMNEMIELPSIITLPQFKKCKMSNFKLVKIAGSKVLMIIVADTGAFKTIPINFIDAKQSVLDEISDAIGDKLENILIEEINVKKMSSITFEVPEYSAVFEYLLPILRNVFSEMNEIDVVVSGISALYELEEFIHESRAKELYEMINDKKIISQILDPKENNNEGISIKIGHEIGIKAMEDCSLVSCSYKVNGISVGKLAVLGPKRMDYGRAVSVLNYVRDTLSEMFSGINL